MSIFQTENGLGRTAEWESDETILYGSMMEWKVTLEDHLSDDTAGQKLVLGQRHGRFCRLAPWNLSPM